MTQRILFVCLGNICRSPTAEGVLRAKAAERGAPLEIESAGTGDWHVGAPPYGAMQDAALRRGYDLSAQRARQVTVADFHRFDLILALDAENRADLERMAPPGARARVAMFTDYLTGAPADHVPDPYYTRDFEETLDLVERAAADLLDALGYCAPRPPAA